MTTLCTIYYYYSCCKNIFLSEVVNLAMQNLVLLNYLSINIIITIF